MLKYQLTNVILMLPGWIVRYQKSTLLHECSLHPQTVIKTIIVFQEPLSFWLQESRAHLGGPGKTVEVDHNCMETCDVSLSKRLCWLLRHGAIKECLNMTPDGFVPVNEVLNHRAFRGKLSIDSLKRLVESNDKKRFTLATSAHGVLLIRANQGHSIQDLTDLQLTRIKRITDVPGGCVVHGTYEHCWPNIVNHGLSRMSRVHIHFCGFEPGDKRIISGLRKSAHIYIYIDVDKAVKDGICFFKSTNDVILSPGDEDGLIKPVYFLKVVHVKTGDILKV